MDVTRIDYYAPGAERPQMTYLVTENNMPDEIERIADIKRIIKQGEDNGLRVEVVEYEQ
jgi:hypothetical protein